jgi:hypothetical protein
MLAATADRAQHGREAAIDLGDLESGRDLDVGQLPGRRHTPQVRHQLGIGADLGACRPDALPCGDGDHLGPGALQPT